MPRDELQDIVDGLRERLRENAEASCEPRRRRAAERLSAALERLAAQAPPAPTDAESRRMVADVEHMLRTLFPSWNPRGKDGE